MQLEYIDKYLSKTKNSSKLSYPDSSMENPNLKSDLGYVNCKGQKIANAFLEVPQNEEKSRLLPVYYWHTCFDIFEKNIFIP